MLAIGFIETLGMLPAIEAADAMLKAAEVRLLEKNLVGGGLVTVTVAGEVSAVQASVDAATASIKRIKGATLFSRHVIARPDPEISRILRVTPGPMAEALQETAGEEDALPDNGNGGEDAGGPARPPEDAEDTVGAEGAEGAVDAARQEIPGKGRLKKMGLSALRDLALSLEGIPYTREDIASANKNTLIDGILTAYRQMKE